MGIRGFSLLSNYFLDVEFVADENNLFLVDSEAAVEIMKIGDRPTALVLKTIDKYFYYKKVEVWRF